jgi:hypothetical protein
MLSDADIYDMSPEYRHFGRFFLVERVLLFSNFAGVPKRRNAELRSGGPQERQEIAVAKLPGGMSKR